MVLKTFFPTFSKIFRRGRGIRVPSEPIGSVFSNTATGETLSFFPNAHDIIVTNPVIYYGHEGHDIVTPAMKSLSEHIIHGAEFDSSIRDPPPRCHPGTRVELNDKINQWFNDEGRQKALLWLNGPAGVGKSAVTQTFAEFLATSKRLGASLFFSKHNRRRDPQKVFITVAFQLAVRVPSYRIYVAEQIALDPSLLKKGLKEQFRILIAEPFGNGGFGNEVKPLGILLDGLDECEGVDQQCEIVQLVSEFVLNFPQAPLVWVIASRPEPHITATFRDEIVIPSHWSEYMPIDSTEACQDVERYLRASFKSIRKRFSYISSKWPSETQFLKLSHGASGLFVFATVAVRFIGNADYADPVSRLKLILTVIDRVKVIVTDDHPFALLDAVYTEILVSIPDPLLLITKRILGFFLCAQGVYPSDVPTVSLKSRNLVAASIILDLEQSVVYASLHKLYSVLRIPRPGNAHKHGVSFLHTSFADYLTDPIRSKELFVDVGESADNIIHHLCEIYTQKPWDNKSNQRAHQLSRKKKKNLYQNLKHDAGIALTYHVIGDLKSARGRGPFLSQQDRSECLEILSQIDIAELYANDYRPQKLIEWLFKLWQKFPEEVQDKGLVRMVHLRDLKFNHLDHQKNKPFSIVSGGIAERSSPGSVHAVEKFVAELERFQRYSPNTRVLICRNSTSEKRNALFYHTYADWGNHWTEGSYCIPYC